MDHTAYFCTLLAHYLGRALIKCVNYIEQFLNLKLTVLENEIHLHLRCHKDAIQELLSAGAESILIKGIMSVKKEPQYEFEMYGEGNENQVLKLQAARDPVSPMP